MRHDRIGISSAAGGLLHFLRVSKGCRFALSVVTGCADSLCFTCIACNVTSRVRFCSSVVCGTYFELMGPCLLPAARWPAWRTAARSTSWSTPASESPTLAYFKGSKCVAQRLATWQHRSMPGSHLRTGDIWALLCQAVPQPPRTQCCRPFFAARSYIYEYNDTGSSAITDPVLRAVRLTNPLDRTLHLMHSARGCFVWTFPLASQKLYHPRDGTLRQLQLFLVLLPFPVAQRFPGQGDPEPHRLPPALQPVQL